MQQNQLLQHLLANQEVNITPANRAEFFRYYAAAAAKAADVAAPADAAPAAPAPADAVAVANANADAPNEALATDAIKAAKKHGFKIGTEENTKLASLYYCMRLSWRRIIADSSENDSVFYTNEEAIMHINSHLTRVKAMFSHLIGSEAKAAKEAFFQRLNEITDDPGENFEDEIEAEKQIYRQHINSSSQTDQKQSAGQQNVQEQKQDQVEKNKKLQIEMMNAIAHEYMFACATLRATKNGGCVARYKGKVQVLTLGLDEVKARYEEAQREVTTAGADLKESAQNCLDSRQPADALEDQNLRDKIKAIFDALAGSDKAWEKLEGDKKVTFARHALQLISGRYKFKLEDKNGSYCAKVVSTSWSFLKSETPGNIFAQMYNVVMDNQPRSREQLEKDKVLERVQNERFGRWEALNQSLAEEYREQARNTPQPVMPGGGVGAEAAQAHVEAARAAQAGAAPKPR